MKYIQRENLVSPSYLSRLNDLVSGMNGFPWYFLSEDVSYIPNKQFHWGGENLMDIPEKQKSVGFVHVLMDREGVESPWFPHFMPLCDAVNDAMRDWVATVEESYYCLGSVMGPHPYPWMVRTFHEIIGVEARRQTEQILGTTPDVVCACVGGGSNAIGIFSGFIDTDTELVGVEPAGGAAIGRGVPGVVHGMESFLMQDEFGQVLEAESISAGLDYPGVGPEHSYLSSTGRARYESVTDHEVIEAFQLLSRTEGIIPALEPAHALAWVYRERESLRGKSVLLNLSGRGDKDVGQMMEVLNV